MRTFYFYDLETSGFNPRTARIMQFAGQRTNMDLTPVGGPDNFLIKMTPEVLPDPDAVLVTGITPQATIADGITEAEFTKYLIGKVCTPDTIMVGYNNIRFDDEFLRFILWRNFYDAYEWHYKNDRGRWDLLDMARITRALRPEGIKWPFAPDGKPTNRLEFLTSLNQLTHDSAHDALSDVHASIAVAKLIKTRQPKLFNYLLNLRDKNKVEALVNKGEPLLYTSGRYQSEFEKTTIAVRIASNPFKVGALMYDLRIDPDAFTDLQPAELNRLWNLHGKDAPYFPVKTLAYNRCPALAPLSVLDKEACQRIKIDTEQIKKNLAKLQKARSFSSKLTEALGGVRPKKQAGMIVDEQEVDGMLYDAFVPNADKTKMSMVRAADKNQLQGLEADFVDERLNVLLPLYKARNFSKNLSEDEQRNWQKFCRHRLLDGGQNSLAGRYFKRLNELSASLPTGRHGAGKDGQNQYLLEELNLYGQSIVPLV